MSVQSERDKRDAKRYRFIKKLARAQTTARSAYFWIMIQKEHGLKLFGESARVTNYRTLNAAVDRLMRDAKGTR